MQIKMSITLSSKVPPGILPASQPTSHSISLHCTCPRGPLASFSPSRASVSSQLRAPAFAVRSTNICFSGCLESSPNGCIIQDSAPPHHLSKVTSPRGLPQPFIPKHSPPHPCYHTTFLQCSSAPKALIRAFIVHLSPTRV